MNLELFALITNLCFLVGFAFADLRHKKDIPAYAVEPLFLAYGLFGLLCLWLFPSVLFFANMLIIYALDKLRLFGNGDSLLLGFSAFIMPFNFIAMIILALLISKPLSMIKKEKEIEFMPIWALVNVIPLVALLTT